MKKTKILIADDHSVVRAGLRILFRGNPRYTLVGEASDGDAAIRLIGQKRPDVAVLDISMPRMNGIEVTRLVKQKYPGIKVLILTIHEDEEYVYQMIRAGADGYIFKNAEKKEILAAVRAVLREQQFFSPGISQLIINRFIQQAKSQDVGVPAQPRTLTSREQQVLELIAHGMKSREIAEKLFLSVSTVNSHRASLMQKLNIHDAAALVQYALVHGLNKLQSVV